MVNSPHTGQCVLEALYSTHKSDLADAQAGWPGWPFDGSLEARAFHQEQWALSWTTVVLSYADCIATGNPEAFAAFKVPFTPFGTLHPTQRMFEACAGLSDEFVCFPSLSPSPSQG